MASEKVEEAVEHDPELRALIPCGKEGGCILDYDDDRCGAIHDMCLFAKIVTIAETKLAALQVSAPRGGLECAAAEAVADGATEVKAAGALGRFVYNRAEKLMDAKRGTPAGLELAYLAHIINDVEEFGATGLEDRDWEPLQ